MEILECDVCGQILTQDTQCGCSMPKDYLYGVVYNVVPPSDEEE